MDSSSPAETERIGSLLGMCLEKGDVLALIGELGSGKTVLVRGIAAGMGADMREVASPSFTLVNEYAGRVPVFHIDLYRLESDRDLYDIGYYEYMAGDGIAVVEWADRVPHAVPDHALRVTLSYLDVQRRRITFEASGLRSKKIVEELCKNLL